MRRALIGTIISVSLFVAKGIYVCMYLWVGREKLFFKCQCVNAHPYGNGVIIQQYKSPPISELPKSETFSGKNLKCFCFKYLVSTFVKAVSINDYLSYYL